MKIQNWKIFNKAGSPLNWLPSPLLPLVIDSPTGKDAAGYLVTDTNAMAISTEMTNGGSHYDNNDITLAYQDALTGTQVSFDASINFLQIPVFGSAYPLVNYANVSTNMMMTNSIVSLTSTGVDVSLGGLLNFNNNPYIHINHSETIRDYYAAMEVYFDVSVNPNVGSAANLFVIGGNNMGLMWYDASLVYFYKAGLPGEVKWACPLPSVGAHDLKLVWTNNVTDLTLYIDGNAAPKVSTSMTSAAGVDTYIGGWNSIATQNMKFAAIWNVRFNDEHQYQGYPDGSTNAAWVDTIGSWDASIEGLNPSTFTTRDITAPTTDFIVDGSFAYPSVTFASAVFLKPISIGLVETEHLYIFEEDLTNYIRPYDNVNNILYFEFVGDDNEIQFFDIDEDKVEINWSSVVGFDCSTFSEGTPIQLNIGFKSDFEGVFERTIRIYHLVGDVLYTLGEIVVNAEAIGEDERFRTLLGNFGLPDPKDMKDVFKETDINEDLPDWDVLNYKSKQMILEHDKIMPFVGTYKGLINAIKWLGYDDVYIKEWFLNVQDHTKLAILVSYDAKDRMQTMLQFNAAQRKTFKKLNQLSLNYCITKDTGTYDEWGTPETENCYTYNLKEVFIKLLGLKRWLELNIIGVNCRITDLTGEGIYYERIQNLIYETDNIGYDFRLAQTLTPYSPDEMSELVHGDASIRLTFLEMTQTKIEDLPWTFEQMAEYAWSPTDPCLNNHYELDSSTYLADPSSFVLVGATFAFPFVNIQDIGWKLSLENTYAATIGDNLVTNPLFILENEIRYYNIFDSSSVFLNTTTQYVTMNGLYYNWTANPLIAGVTYTVVSGNSLGAPIEVYEDDAPYPGATFTGLLFNVGDTLTWPAAGIFVGYFWRFDNVTLSYQASTDLTVQLEKAYLRDPSNDVWIDSIAYSIYPMADTSSGNYAMESSTGIIKYFDDYVTFTPDSSSRLEYSVDANYKVPLLTMKNFSATPVTGPDVSFGSKTYILDILDGKISMNAGNVRGSADNTMTYLNFNYDTSLSEQQITSNVVMTSPRMELWRVDPSIYYHGDPSGLTGGDTSSLIIDNSIYTMHVNHIGNYNMELFAWDGWNTLFHNIGKETYPVYVKAPTIYTLIEQQCNQSCVSTYLTIPEVSTLIGVNRLPIYDRLVPLQGLSVLVDPSKGPYINVPSITYFQDVPEPNSINKFYNLTERVVYFDWPNTLHVDLDFQKFYTGDSISVVQFDKGKYSIVNKFEKIIDDSSMLGNYLTIELASGMSGTQDASSDYYVINTTLRDTSGNANISGAFTTTLSQEYFRIGQNVAIDISRGEYLWGATYRVVDVSNNVYTFDAELPDFFLDQNLYTIKAKHAFTTYAEMQMNTASATETNNEFNIFLSDSRCQEYYLDNTFTMVNVLFDQDVVNAQWYDVSDNLIDPSSLFYYHPEPINVDVSTLVILKATYPPMINYGLLYNFHATAGLAPAGWHIPTEAEFETLLGGTDNNYETLNGDTFKSQYGWYDLNGTNTTGFNMLPSGWRNRFNDGFDKLGLVGIFWGVQYDATRAWLLEFMSSSNIATVAAFIFTFGASIRFIKDDSNDPGSFTDYDGNTYPTVKIGNQVWMAENLRVKHLANGTSIPNVTDNSTWNSMTTKAYSYYNNNPTIGFSENYMLKQKNIWQVTDHDSSTIIFKVFNDQVPYIFNQAGTYDVEVTAYDSFGNAIIKKYEGLIEVIDPNALTTTTPVNPSLPSAPAIPQPPPMD